MVWFYVKKGVEMVQDIPPSVMMKITLMEMAVVVIVKLKMVGFVREELQWERVHVSDKSLKTQLSP